MRFVKVLGWLSVALGLAVAIEATLSMARGPTPLALGPFHLPVRRLQAELALSTILIGLGAWGLIRPFPLNRRWILLGAASFSFLLLNTRSIGSGDTIATSYIPFLAAQGTFTFHEDSWRDPTRDNYWLVPVGGTLASKYPVATGLLAMPMYLPALLGEFDPGQYPSSVKDLEKVAAAALSAIGMVFLYLAMRKIVSERSALIACALYATGTAFLTILGQALWQHTGAALALSFGLWGLLAFRKPVIRGVLVGIAAALAVATRPIDLILALGVVIALLMEDRKAIVPIAAGGLPIGAALLVYNRMMFGSPWSTGYGGEASGGWSAYWPEGVLGLLVSPGRGIFLISPILIFAWAMLFRDRRFRILGLAATIYMVVMGKWWAWDGAYCAGPRMLSDSLPFLGMGLGLAVESLRGRRLRWIFGGVALLSVGIHLLLAFVTPPPRTRALVWSRESGVWDARSWPPAAYWEGFRSGPR